MAPDGLLTNLNSSQQAAVSSFADTLAILAGPGSGKTHTLTSRTAWLLEQGLQPWNVIVATFTVKAAREMKERIGKLIGNGLESKLVLGTFHSIARRYLARYGHLIDIPKDFGIADSADSLAIIKRIVKRHEFMLDPKVARSRISSRKARGHGYVDDKPPKKVPAKLIEGQEFEQCYTEYEEALKRSNLLDYDDLLLRCVELLRNHPSCVSNVEAVLIDEFQDTNVVQFDLMRLFASARKRITIVGDPDQSIYGFRAAEIKNYKRLLHQYPDTVTIALEENYRSSGAILLTALSVIEQDSSRVAKTLMPTHTVGTCPVLRKLPNAYIEAEWIIFEIQRCISSTGDLLNLNDIAILLRSASLSRLIESALGKAGIPYRMVGGLRFYDRIEVKTILDYLRVISQPDNNDALSRVINTPSRRIGEATIKGLLEEADQSKITLWTLIMGAVQGKRTPKIKLNKSTEKGLSEFVNIILTARSKVADSDRQPSIVDLINIICKRTNYENWLKDHHADAHGARWDNVQELVTQARDFQGLIATGAEDEALPEIDGVEQNEESDHLSRFLANVALASEVKEEENEGSALLQVTISTIHSAKGLEWPVVFIPALYQGSIPHSRSDDTDEERRLLYVAMTRAKSLLYMSIPLKNSQGEMTTLSPFLTPVSLAPLLDQRGPSFPSSTIQSIAQIVRRPLPSVEALSKAALNILSPEDDLYPDGDEEVENDKELSYSTDKATAYTRGQLPAKRRRIEFGQSISDVEQGSKTHRGPTSTTSLYRASSLTATSSVQKTAFLSGGSLLALNEQSVNRAVGSRLVGDAPSESILKTGGTQKNKTQDGQGTLHSFLGKGDPRLPKRTIPGSDSAESFKEPKPVSVSFFAATSVRQSNSTMSGSEVSGIAPDLASHRIGFSRATRPTPAVHLEQHERNDYVFLSSSPPRQNPSPKKPEAVPHKPPGPSTKPLSMPLTRPATCMHTTTVAGLQGSGPKRTLGVKRSMNGWPSQKGNGFVPPTIRRPR